MSIFYFSFNNPVFSNFAFYASASVVKMMAMSSLTAYRRITKDAFANPEDLSLAKNKSAVVVTNDTDVERVRRNHLNDLENIIPFAVVGLLYVATNPKREVALWHFRVFFFSRLLHTLTYQLSVPQPSRLLTCLIGYLTTLSMAGRIFFLANP